MFEKTDILISSFLAYRLGFIGRVRETLKVKLRA
jgi:hypothetical protein